MSQYHRFSDIAGTFFPTSSESPFYPADIHFVRVIVKIKALGGTVIS